MKKLEFIGFHATSQENANKIMRDDFIINQKRNNEWLGHGVYLFKHKIDANSWADGTYYCKPNPSLIKCFVEITKEKYLDLDNPEKLNEYYVHFNQVLELLSEQKMAVSFKSKEEAMCWGLNIYKQNKNIDVITYTFTNNRTKNAMNYGHNKMVYNYNEVQICVSKGNVIVKKELCS